MPYGSVHEVVEVPKGCPWEHWKRPSLKYCESHFCSYVTAPANAWSNLGYVFFGLWMMFDARNKHPVLWWMGVANVMVGVSSFAFHASYTLDGQVFDFLGMYGFILIPVVLNLRRLQLISKSSQFFWFSVLMLGLTAVTVIIQYELLVSMFVFRIQNLVAILVVTLFVQELALMTKQNAKRGNFWRSVLLILVAFGFSIADVQGYWCNPDNHWFQGHAMWHVVGSIALQYSYLFYQQFDFDKDPLLPVKNKK